MWSAGGGRSTVRPSSAENLHSLLVALALSLSLSLTFVGRMSTCACVLQTRTAPEICVPAGRIRPTLPHPQQSKGVTYQQPQVFCFSAPPMCMERAPPGYRTLATESNERSVQCHELTRRTRRTNVHTLSSHSARTTVRAVRAGRHLAQAAWSARARSSGRPKWRSVLCGRSESRCAVVAATIAPQRALFDAKIKRTREASSPRTMDIWMSHLSSFGFDAYS